MTTTALSCGNVERETRPVDTDVRWFDLPATPARTEVDPLIKEATGRIVVHGTDSDLATVVLRVLRKERLAELSIGYIPVGKSAVANLWGIPVGGFAQALREPARATPLIRDDSGGVLLGHGAIEPITGQVYCDDRMLLNGPALGLIATPDPRAEPLSKPTDDPIATQPPPPMDGVIATVTRRGMLRRKRLSARGRAVQASCEEATVVHDGITHPRGAQRWAWYRHTRDLLFVRP